MGTEGIQDKYINPYTDFGFKLSAPAPRQSASCSARS